MLAGDLELVALVRELPNRRTFSTAMTAWSANVFNNATSASESGPGSRRVTLMAPTALSCRSIGIDSKLLNPIARPV